MTEKFIAKGEEVLTRVILEVDDNKFTVETPYSDSDLLKISMQCIESAVELYGVDKKIFLENIKHVIDKDFIELVDHVFIKHVRLTMEQWEDRHIVEIVNPSKFTKSLIMCLKSCAVLSTYLSESVDNYLVEYLEENYTSDENEELTAEE